MMPSITATITLLLLAYLIGAASSTEGRASTRMLPPIVLPEITLEEYRVRSAETINMTLFKWLYDMEKNVTNLTICTEKELIGEGESVIISPTLLYELEEDAQKNIEGQVLDGNFCSLFTEIGNIPLALNETLYHLSVIASNGSSIIYRSGNRTFGMPVKTSTLSCSGKNYTRAAQLTSDITFDPDHPCINDDQRLSNDSVCYLEGQFSSSYLCYTSKVLPELQVCLQGSSLTTADEVDGRQKIEYLSYERNEDTPDAHLSLEFDTESADGMEVIIWKKGEILTTSCQNNICFIPAFKPEFVHYDVCAVMLVNDLANTSFTDTIADLNVDAFMYDDSPLLQFDFINANNEQFYLATLAKDEPSVRAAPNVTVDCTAVPANKTCHGYFEDHCDNLRVAIEYFDAETDTVSNKIIVKCRLIGK